jgi:hypothetical protein
METIMSRDERDVFDCSGFTRLFLKAVGLLFLAALSAVIFYKVLSGG